VTAAPKPSGTQGVGPSGAAASQVAPNVLEHIEPGSGQPLPPVPISSIDDVCRAVRDAKAAQKRWASLSWRARRERLLVFRNVLFERADEVMDVLMREVGKVRFEAFAHEIFPIADLTHYYATRAHKLLRDQRIALHLFWPLKRAYLRYEPRGVVGVISPWNFPFTVPMGEVVMALCARNAAVVKPSEWAPRTMLAAKSLFVDAGFDPELLQVVVGGRDTAVHLIENGVDMISFTGSVSAGRDIAARCGKLLIPCVTELGGKDAALVFDDVDIATTARRIVWGAFANSGQLCASVERVLVHASIHDAFVAELVRLTQSLRQGDPVAAGTQHVDVGPMVVPGQILTVAAHVEDARSKGARVLHGGYAFERAGGRFFAPTVVTDVRGDMRIWSEETFGPCMAIRTFEHEHEAVSLANESDLGLTAYVFTRDRARADRVANHIEAGSVIVNDVLYHHAVPETPWGGVKHSGIGRVHGHDALRNLCWVRHVAVPRVNVTPPWVYPYREHTFRWFRTAMQRLYRGVLGRLL